MDREQVEQDDKDDVRQIRPDTEDGEKAAVDQNRNRRPVLVVGLPQAEEVPTADSSVDDERPIVDPEPLVAVLPEQECERRDERDPMQRHSKRFDVTLLAGAPQGSEHTQLRSWMWVGAVFPRAHADRVKMSTEFGSEFSTRVRNRAGHLAYREPGRADLESDDNHRH